MIRISLMAVVIAACNPRLGTSPGAAPDDVDDQCTKAGIGHFPSRHLICPPGTNAMALGDDARLGTTTRGSSAARRPTRQIRPGTPAYRLGITGLQVQWCARGQVKHGPYVARFPKKHLIISGQYENGEKSGVWTYWNSSGYLLRYKRYGAGSNLDGPDVRCGGPGRRAAGDD